TVARDSALSAPLTASGISSRTGPHSISLSSLIPSTLPRLIHGLPESPDAVEVVHPCRPLRRADDLCDLLEAQPFLHPQRHRQSLLSRQPFQHLSRSRRLVLPHRIVRGSCFLGPHLERVVERGLLPPTLPSQRALGLVRGDRQQPRAERSIRSKPAE